MDCITFDDVLDHLPGCDLDLLQIDAEGADALILSLFPFSLVRPFVVHWEVRHLSLRNREDCLGRLAEFSSSLRRANKTCWRYASDAGRSPLCRHLRAQSPGRLFHSLS